MTKRQNDKIKENLEKFIKQLEKLREATEDVMPLVAKSIGLTIEIAKTYQQAIGEVLNELKRK